MFRTMLFMRHWGFALVLLTGCELYEGTGGDEMVPDDDTPVDANVYFTFCDATQAPLFVASRNGDDEWRAVSGTTNEGKVTFGVSITEERGGVLFVTRSSTEYITEVMLATQDELAVSAQATCMESETTKQFGASVTSLPTGALATVSSTLTTAYVTTSPSTSVLEVPVGVHDVVASRTLTLGSTPDKIVVLRNIDALDGSGTSIDFNGPQASTPAKASVTIFGAAGELLETYVDVVTAHGRMNLWSENQPSYSTTRSWAGLSAPIAGDFHGLVVFAMAPDGSGDFRLAMKYAGTVADQTLALGPAISAPETTVIATGAYPRLRITGSVPAAYDKGVVLDITPRDRAGNIYNVTMTGGYLDGGYDFTMPDLMAFDGFPSASRLSAEPYRVAADGYAFTGPGTFDLTPTIGAEYWTASKSVSVNIPQ
jgi:hypothetical protein